MWLCSVEVIKYVLLWEYVLEICLGMGYFGNQIW